MCTGTKIGQKCLLWQKIKKIYVSVIGLSKMGTLLVWYSCKSHNTRITVRATWQSTQTTAEEHHTKYLSGLPIKAMKSEEFSEPEGIREHIPLEKKKKCIYLSYTGNQVVAPRALEVVAPTTGLSWFLWKQCLLSPSKYSASYMQCLSQASQHNDMAWTKKVSVPYPTSLSLWSDIWWWVDPGHPQ